MPRLWHLYLLLFLHPCCPPTLAYTHARRTFDRALRALPPSLHLRVWALYLRWAERLPRRARRLAAAASAAAAAGAAGAADAGGGEEREEALRAMQRGAMETCRAVWRRYLRVDPSLTERYVRLLVGKDTAARAKMDGEEEEAQEDEDEAEEEEEEAEEDPTLPSRALEAAKLLLQLARAGADGTYVSPERKSPLQLLLAWLALVDRFPEEIGMAEEEEEEERKRRGLKGIFDEEDAGEEGEKAAEESGMIVPAQARKGKAPASATAQKQEQAQLNGVSSDPHRKWETDPLDGRKLPISLILQADGLAKYPDQAGRLWTGLATYHLKRSEFARARATFEQGMRAVVTVRDFTQIFDAYAETSEGVLAFLMEELAELEAAGAEADEEGVTRAEKEAEIDARMHEFERLMERRPFLVNDVLLRRNPNDVQEWEKRVLLHGDDDEKVVETYTKAIATIHPKKATANHHQLFLNFAKFYEQGGSHANGEEGEGDLESARQIFEKAVTIPFRKVDELAEVWCEYAEMEVRHSNYDVALRLLARATQPPARMNAKHVNYHDESQSVHVRLFKSLKLWSFYIDLEESLGTVDSAKQVYDRILELKIANAQIIVNYAAFLEENRYFEEAFKVYERGVDAFTYPVAFELWNVYLGKFVKRYVSVPLRSGAGDLTARGHHAHIPH